MFTLHSFTKGDSSTFEHGLKFFFENYYSGTFSIKYDTLKFHSSEFWLKSDISDKALWITSFDSITISEWTLFEHLYNSSRSFKEGYCVKHHYN